MPQYSEEEELTSCHPLTVSKDLANGLRASHRHLALKIHLKLINNTSYIFYLPLANFVLSACFDRKSDYYGEMWCGQKHRNQAKMTSISRL